MSLILLVLLVNIAVAGMAIIGIIKGRHPGIGYVAGLSALVALPFANVSFLAFLFEGIPYFNFLSLAGVSLVTIGTVAVVGALFSFFVAMRNGHG